MFCNFSEIGIRELGRVDRDRGVATMDYEGLFLVFEEINEVPLGIPFRYFRRIPCSSFDLTFLI
jgi:hypothetical protein